VRQIRHEVPDDLWICVDVDRRCEILLGHGSHLLSVTTL
jgi:hypothetical protein